MSDPPASADSKGSRIRRYIFFFALLLLFIFIFTRLSEVEEVADSMQQGDWRWLGLALLAHFISLVNVGVSLHVIYHLLGVEESFIRLTVLSITANFLNAVAPTAGISGMSAFLEDARQTGHNPGRVTTAMALYALFDYFSILFMLALGLIALFRRNQLTTTEIIASLIYVLLVISLVTILYLGMRSEKKLHQFLGWLSRFGNKVSNLIIHKNLYDAERAYKFVHEFAHDINEGLREVRHSPNGLILPVFLSLTNKIFLIMVLAFIFLAFGQPITLGTLIGGWSIGYLFRIVSPIPTGLGFVEGAMTLTLTSLRVSFANAVVITLAYRGITFWVSLGYGLIAFRFLSRSRRSRSSKKNLLLPEEKPSKQFCENDTAENSNPAEPKT